MTTTRKKIKKQQKLNQSLKEKLIRFVLSSQGLPLVLMFITLGVLFVFIRMKSVEQHYVYNEIMVKTDELNTENKELKAKKARMLSINNLRSFAKKYNLKEPTQNQVIMIP